MTAARLEPSDGLEPLAELLARHGLARAAEEPFPNDGWSGATLTRLRDADQRPFILKRDALDRDWIAQATGDRPLLREAWFAAHGPALPRGVRNPALGAGWDAASGGVGILMPDLSGTLFDWSVPVPVHSLELVLGGLAALHAAPRTASGYGEGRWCPLLERVTLICRPALERRGPARDAVAGRLLPGWDAWDRRATPAAREVIRAIAADPRPLLRALQALPATLIHGDLKLANAGIAADGAVELVDWQLVMVAPVAVELGWFLVSNVTALPLPPDEVLATYWRSRNRAGGSENELAILVGLLLRGWRKGADAEAGVVHASGVTAADDLAWWCERAVEAADRLL
ncbi:MAG TPA: phosphotransferase [Patescibacteria group bacterium]|nr:phosphotransferase [Patescibacteria group bacterium]